MAGRLANRAAETRLNRDQRDRQTKATALQEAVSRSMFLWALNKHFKTSNPLIVPETLYLVMEKDPDFREFMDRIVTEKMLEKH